MALFRTEMGNSWADVCMDDLKDEKNRKECKKILYKMFSFDREEASKYWDTGYKRLKELGETDIIECIDKRYYLMFAGGRE